MHGSKDTEGWLGMRCRVSDKRLGKFHNLLKELRRFAFGSFDVETLLAKYLENYFSKGLDILSNDWTNEMRRTILGINSNV